MTHPLSTAAGLRRALRPGTPVRIENHIRPTASRVTTVHARTNTRALATYATDRAGKVVPSFLNWPKATDLDPDPAFTNVVTIMHGPGEPFLTLTILSDAALGTVPAAYRADTTEATR